MYQGSLTLGVCVPKLIDILQVKASLRATGLPMEGMNHKPRTATMTPSEMAHIDMMSCPRSTVYLPICTIYHRSLAALQNSLIHQSFFFFKVAGSIRLRFAAGICCTSPAVPRLTLRQFLVSLLGLSRVKPHHGQSGQPCFFHFQDIFFTHKSFPTL